MDIYEEKRIVKEAQKNPKVFGLIFDEFYRPIFNYVLRRIPNIRDAQDITSETFFKALKGLGKFRWQNIPFSAWLYRIATNEINNFYRKKGDIIKINIEQAPEIPSQENIEKEIIEAEKELENKKEFLKLHESIKKLSVDYQTIITLRFFEKKKISEICQIINKPEGTVKSQIHRALERLKNIMLDEKTQPF